MVTKYSGRTGSVKGRTKLVLTYSPTSVKNSTSSVKVTAKLYYESTYRTQDSFNTAKMSGSLGSWSGDMSINGTSVHIKTLTKTVSTSYSGSKRITVSASLSGVEASPGSHSVSASITIPKRPVSKPKTPTNVKMALLSDNRTKTTWSHSTSTAQPVSSYTVQYQRLDGGAWTGWMHSATVKGKSYTSNPGANNKSYRRRVRANNSAGSSGWAYSNYVRMQPYAPVNVRAKVQPSGSDIKVTWDFNSPAESTCLKLQLQRRVNGGSWTTVSSSFGQVNSKPYTSSYTDTKPGNGSNQYRIRILNNCEGDNSVWAESNTVSTIVPPKAPTNLSPDGNVVDFTGDVLFTWQHHDAGDGADQTHYDLRYRAEGETAWTYAPDGGNTSEKSEHLFEGGELENGVNYEWQVKTQGNTKEDYGPWSKSAFVTGWTTPVVAIKDGAPPNPLTALPVPLAWTYAQDEGQGQIGWQARLYSLGSGDMFDSILEEKSAESSSTQTEFTTALTDGGRYGIMVRARSSQGQWSEWSETTFDVELLVPAELRVDLDYGEATGQMNLNIVSDEAVQGETAPVVSIDVQRRINGGEWVPIMVGIPFDSETTLVDNIPSIWGVNEYRVTATTEAPSKGVFGPFRKTVTPYIGNTENWLFLNYGETFDYMLKMQGDLSMSGSYERSKETQKLLGRKKPISLLGQQLSREHQVTGTVEYHEECEFPDVPDVPRELVGSAFFDDARAWNFSKVQAGPDSQITADAHYRAKRYGYLMDVVEGNTENLVSPSPRSGVPGSEVPGREVEEVVARNLWRGSKLSEDISGLSITSTLHTEQIADGLQITNPDGYTGASTAFHQTKAGGVTGIVPGQKYSAAVPLRNDGADPIMIKVALIERSGGGTSLYSRTDYGQILQPGETRVFRLEDYEAQSANNYLTVTMYYNSSDPFLTENSALTVLDGITLVADDVAADPFNGDGAQKHDELVTDSQSLYRWTGAEAASESEKYLPAAPGHFDEYSEWLNVEPGGTYQVEAFVKAPDLRSVARRNLTSQGQFATDRRLWGSASLRSGLGADWSDESEFEYGAVRLMARFSTMFPTPTAYLATDVKASTLGVTSLAGAEFTLGIDVYSEEDSGADQKILIKPMDSAGELVGDWIEQTFRSTQEITRQVMRFTLPVGTESFEIRLTNPVATVLFASNVTFEEGATDGSWIEEETGREWLGAENIDTVQLMVEEFDADGESLSIETVAELGQEDFSNRWRTIAGEYTVGLGASTVRTWVEWVVNGDHPELQSDWYFGGMKATNVYVVPERWPGPDSNPDEWREAQYESTTVCLRTPSGHRVFGAMSGLDINAVEGSLDLAEVSFTVTETDYTENPLVIDESDIWDNVVVDAQDDSLVFQPGEIETQPGWGNIIVNPYSGSDA